MQAYTSTLPCRIQRKRIAGWVQPDNTRYVGRPSIFANPFDWREVGRERAVKLFRQWLNGDLDDRYPDFVSRRRQLVKRLKELRGKNLSCWCPEDEPCHVDVLIEAANK